MIYYFYLNYIQGLHFYNIPPPPLLKHTQSHLHRPPSPGRGWSSPVRLYFPPAVSVAADHSLSSTSLREVR